MAVNIKLKRSAVSGNVPTTSQLELGEIALNTYDGKAFFKKDVDGVQSIVEIASTGSTVASASYALYAATAGTASFAITAASSSYALSSSYSATATSASYALSASNSSNTISSSYALSASFAQTSSYATNFNVSGNLVVGGDITAKSLHVQTVTSSVIFSSGSNILGDATNDTQTLIGTVNISGSLNVTGSATINDLTGSLYGTASWALDAVTAINAPRYTLTSSFQSFTQSYYTDSASVSTRVTNLEQFSASILNYTSSTDAKIASIYNATSSLQASSASLNAFSASILIYTASNDATTASIYLATASLNAQTASLLNYTSSNDAKITSIYLATSSLNAFSASILNYTASNDAAIASIYLTTASLNSQVASLLNYTSSNDAKIASIYNATSSLNAFSASILNYTTSIDAKITSIYNSTSSLQSATASLNAFSASILSYTASNDANITSLNAQTASLLNYTSSNNASISAIYAQTASLLNYTSSTDAKITSIYNATSSLQAATASLNAFSASMLAFTASYGTGSFTGSFKGNFTGSFSGSLANLQGTATHIPFFSSSQVLDDSAMYQVGTESIAINQNAVTTAAPEALYVWQPNTSSFNVISGKGNLDNYLQLNIQNTNQGPTASSDIVATANNGNEITNYIDMGINSENFSGFLGGPNDAYVYAAGNEFHIGNITPNKHLGFFVGGGDVDAGNKFALYPNNQHQMTGSLDVSGSVKAFNFTGSLLGTASFANNATSASYALTASYAANVPDTASFAISASYAVTASSADNFTVRGTLTAQTIVAQVITSSTDFVTGSTKFGTIISNTHQFTGSVSVSGSLAVNGSNVILTNQTSSMSVLSASYASGSTSASFASTANSASYALVATSASFANNATSASYALSSSFSATATSASYAISASTALTASYITASNVAGLNLSQITSGSVTASVDPNGFKVNSNATISGSTQITGSLGVTGSVSITGSGTVLSANVDAISFTGSFAQSGSVTVVGSVNATSFTGSLLGTASYAAQANSASFASTASFVTLAQTASFVTTAQTASFVLNAQTASFVLNAVSSSFASTASSADNFTVRGTLTAQTIVAQTITSSTDFVTGSTKFGTLTSNTHQFTGSVSVSGSLAVNGSNVILTNQTGAMSVATASYVENAQTASFVQNAQTASYVVLAQTASFVQNAVSASFASTASFVALAQTASFVQNAQTASYVLNAVSASYAANADLLDGKDSSTFATTGSNTFRGNQIVTGSLLTSGSNTLVGSTTLTGSLNISGSETIAGYVQFMPVTTNIDNSVSASYIYVSGSTNDLYFSQNGKGYSNTTRLRWLEGNLYTGLLNGGVITAATGSTTYQISSGSGIIVNLNASLNDNPYPTIQYLNWGNLTGSISAFTSSFQQVFVGIDSTNNIFAQGTPFNNGQFDTVINIGGVFFQNGSTINAVKTQPSVAYGAIQAQNIFNRAFGPLKLSGYTLAPSGSSTLGLVVGSGTAYAPGSNYTVDPNEPSYTVDSGTSISKIFRYHQSGSTWVYDTNAGAGYTTINPGQYSNNGTLTTVQPNDWSIQRVFWFPNSVVKAIVVYYGNQSYSTEAEAIANLNIESFVEAPNTAANAVYLGAIVIRGNGLLTVPADFTILPGGLFRQVGGSGGGGSIVTQTLSGLSDVSISGPTSGQALVYDTTATKWENKSFISASISGNAATATTASFASTASFVTLAQTASFVQTAQTASYILNAVSSSFASTASYVLNAVSSSFASTASFVQNAQTASYVLNAISASHAVTASSADNFLVRGTLTAQTIVAQTITSSTDFVTGSTRFGSLLTNTHQFTGSVSITGSLNAPSITGSLLGTASFANNATSASYALTASNIEGGTANYLPLWLNNTKLTSSIVYQNATGIGVNDVVPTHRFQVNGDAFMYNNSSTLNATKYALLPALNVTVTGSESNQYANTSIYGSLGYSATAGTFTPQDNSFVSAFLGNVIKSGAGNVTGKMSSFAAGVNFSGTGNVTTVAGFRAYAPLQSFALPSFTGTLTNYIGLLIDDITGTTDIGSRITNKYGIYQSGSLDRNYFAGATIFASGLTGSLEGTASYAVTASYAMNGGGGGGGGLSALYIQDEGVTQGTASYIDFTGAGVTATVTGGTASIAITGGGGGGGGAQTFTQTTPAVSWSFTHNLGTYTPIVQVYDSSYNTIQPSSIVGTSLNATTITFAAATSGYAIISTGGSINVTGSNVILSQTVAATTWSFNHGLNEKYPVFTIFDSNDDVIIPLRINAVDANTALIYFSTARTGTAVAANCGVSGSFATSSFAISSSYAVSASFASNAAQAATASYVVLAQTASFVQTAQTASYVLNAVSASYAATASFVTLAQTASFVQTAQTASYILNAISASHAVTASSADNFTVRGTLTAQTIVAQTITSSTDFVTGSTRFGSLLANTHQFTGSVGMTGSLSVSGNATVSNNILIGVNTSGGTSTSTPLYVDFGNTFGSNTAGTVGNLKARLFSAGSNLYGLGISNNLLEVQSGVNGGISFFVNQGTQSLNLASTGVATFSNRVSISGSLTVITGSGIEFQVTDTGVKIGNVITDIHTVTGSLNVSGSTTATSFTGSLLGTASFASNAATASYVLNAVSASFANNATSASFATTATTATTASYATNFTVANTLILDATLTDYASVASSIVGSNNIFTQNTGSYTSAFFKYTVRNGANTRAGEAIVAWNGTTVSFTDFSTVDIGSTSAVTASAAIVAGQIQFNIQTNTSGWNIKSIGTFM